MTAAKTRKDPLQMEAVNRISKLPVVETGVHYAKFMYGKIKNSNSLVQWSLENFEDGLQLAIDKSLNSVPFIDMPLNIVDAIVCKSLDTIEQRVPAIHYTPDRLINMTKDLVSSKIVQPVVKRADSVKQFSVQGATKYGEIAASHLDNALNVADNYVEKYLPDVTDNVDSKDSSHAGESKTVQTIQHVNRFSRKLQRRLTKRTIAEARALKRQGTDAAQFLLYLLDLAVKDPKKFMEKMKTIWSHLSQDEPENQIPPANLEQLITMLTRETARRFVHLTNYGIATATKLPSYSVQLMHIINVYVSYSCNFINKTVNLERVKDLAVVKAKLEFGDFFELLLQLYSKLAQLTDNTFSRLNKPTEKPQAVAGATEEKTPIKKKEEATPQELIKDENKSDSEPNQNNSKQETATEKANTATKKEIKQEQKKKKSKEVIQLAENENSNNVIVENGGASHKKK